MPEKDHPHYEAMLRLRLKQKLTLKEIGRLFGVTGQRVHQILGNTGRVSDDKLREEIMSFPASMSNVQVAKKLGVARSTVDRHRSRTFFIAEGGNARTSTKAKRYVAKRLRQAGFAVKVLPRKHKHDLLIDGYVPVAVIGCTTPAEPPSRKTVSPLWRFNVRAKYGAFVLCLTGDNDIFVIPRTAVPRKKEELCFCFPTLRPTMGKYQKYHERFDLLRQAAATVRNTEIRISGNPKELISKRELYTREPA